MSSEQELVRFVREALAAGATREEITVSLREAGWTPPQISEALGAFTGSLSGLPVPRPRASSETRDTFVYGGMFVSLFFMAWAFGGMAFALIDITLGDGATEGLLRQLRWPLSIAIVATPVFVLLKRLVEREEAADPNRRISTVRRTLTYFTLFISACVLLGTAAVLVYNLLGGELALTFGLKSLVVAGISGTGFLHYLREMQRDAVEQTQVPLT